MKPTISVRLSRGAAGSARPSPSVGRRLRRDGKLAEAEKIFRACLQHHKGDIEAWIGLSTVFADRQNFKDAAYCLWRASQLQPNDLSMLDQLGRLLVLDADYDRAAIVYDDLIGRNPGDIIGYLAKSAVQRLQGDYAESRRTLATGARRNPTTAVPSLISGGTRILRTYGLENSFYIFAPNPTGLPRLSLELGHFSTEYLLDARRQTMIDCRIPGDIDDWRRAVPEHDLVLNTIADPDVETGALHALARLIAAQPAIPVINDPCKVLETTRDGNDRRFRGMSGIRFPRTVRLARSEDGQFDLEACLRRNNLDFPVILRVPGSHTAQTTVLAANREDAVTYLARAVSDEIYVIQYVEQRFHSIFYRKMRVFFIDGEPHPVVHHVDRIWNVHGFNRKGVMAANPWMTDMEKSFISDFRAYLGRDATAVLERLPALVGLDFFGVDFTLTDDGEILIYEMNPVMRHSFDHAVAFPYLRPSLKRISEAFTAMLLSRINA